MLVLTGLVLYMATESYTYLYNDLVSMTTNPSFQKSVSLFFDYWQKIYWGIILDTSFRIFIGLLWI